MRRRILASIIFSVFLGYHPLHSQTSPDRIFRVGDVRVVVSGGRETVMDVAAARMPEAVARQYQMIPDRRLLFAVADIVRLLGTGPLKDVRLSHAGAGWAIQYGADTVGVLPYYADYQQSSALLVRWATRLNARSVFPAGSLTPLVQQRVESAYAELRAPALLTALLELDRGSAGARNVSHVVQAARLLTLLELQSLDAIGMTDEMAGHMTALYAVGRAAGATIAREEALHAFLLGYAANAESMAKQLPAQDPVRMYVQGDTAALRAAADKNGAEDLTQYLHLLRLASRGDVDAWTDWAASHSFGSRVSLALFKPALQLGQFEAEAYIPAVAIPEILAVLNSIPPSANHPANAENTYLSQVETGLRNRHASLNGPFLNAMTFNAFIRAYMYSILYIAALHRLDSQAAPWLARDILSAVRNPAPGPASQFERWLQHVTKAEQGTANVNTLLDDIDNLPLLGHGARMRSFNSALEATDYASPEVVEAARRMASQMDARPAHLDDLGRIAYAQLQDVLLARDVYRHETRLLGHEAGTTEAWLAWLEGNAERALELVRTGPGMPEDRARIARLLANDSLTSPQAITSLFSALYDQSGRRYGVVAELISYHQKRHEHEDVLRIATTWLKEGRGVTMFDTIFAHNAIAVANYQLARYDAARAAVEPVLQRNQANTMGFAALVYQKLNQVQKASELGRKLVDRYPNNAWARGVYAEILWLQGRHSEVPPVLQAPNHGIDAWGWRDQIAPRFARIFKETSVDAALRAAQPLMATSNDTSLAAIEYLAQAADQVGRPDIAFAIESGLRTTSVTGRAQIALRSYRYLRASQGEAKALQWLRSVNIGPPDMVAAVIYREGLLPLLWTLTTSPGNDDSGHYVWLMRAAADVAQDGKDQHHAQLVAHYQQPLTGKYAAAGKYLYGIGSLADLMRYAVDDNSRAELAYYAALRARLRNEHVEEIRWYRAAVETGARQMGEFVFATDALAEWKGSRRHRVLSRR